jgi:uncharacterized OB-fold protein
MGLPTVARDEYSAEFFDAAKRGELLVRRCENGHYMAPTQGYNQPAVRCHECHSCAVRWAPVSGQGTLVTWTVIHSRGSVPATQIAGIIELEEGPWIKAFIDAGNDLELHAGTVMSLDFVKTGDGDGDGDGDGEMIPAFRPA